jgi:monovalent cation/hydrogen antiporter
MVSSCRRIVRMRGVETVLFLVLVATVVAAFAKRLSVPAPSLLVVVGVLAGLVPWVPHVTITPDIISLVVLPPLLFAAGEELPWRDLRQVWRPVSVLAVGLVLASAAVVGLVAVLITPLSFGMALVLGTVLASTDPVAVTALGRRLSLPPRVQALVQAESLFNDATSLLLFRVALSVVVAGGAVSWGHTLAEFLLLAGGGLGAGLVVAGFNYVLRKRTEEPVIEAVLSLATPYAAYVLAEAVHGSGVTAVVVASVVLATQNTKLSSATTRLRVGAVSETVVFLLESVVFGLIGLQLPALVGEVAGSAGWWPLQALALAATLLVMRLLWVFPLAALAQRRQDGGRPSWQVPAVVSWAGARGVVPLAAALSIPLIADRDLVMLLTTAVIVYTLVVQGSTLAPLVRFSGVARSPDALHQEALDARRQAAEAALDHLTDAAEAEAAPPFVIEQLQRSWEERLARITGDTEPDQPSAERGYRALRLELLAVEGAELTRLYECGAISDPTRRRLQRTLDLEQAGLHDE